MTAMPVLEFENVSKSRWRSASKIVLLDSVSLSIDAGDWVAVLGPRGSGKTTLLRLAAEQEQPDSGTVRFAGVARDNGRRPRRALDPRIGWARHDGPAMPLNVVEFVALRLLDRMSHRESRRRALGALKALDADHLATARWPELSNAERTLASVAAALVGRPALLLADEPTMSLDIVERSRVMRVMRTAIEQTGTAVLMTTPELPDRIGAIRILSLGGGELNEARRSSQAASIIPLPLRDKSA